MTLSKNAENLFRWKIFKIIPQNFDRIDKNQIRMKKNDAINIQFVLKTKTWRNRWKFNIFLHLVWPKFPLDCRSMRCKTKRNDLTHWFDRKNNFELNDRWRKRENVFLSIDFVEKVETIWKESKIDRFDANHFEWRSPNEFFSSTKISMLKFLWKFLWQTNPMFCHNLSLKNV